MATRVKIMLDDDSWRVIGKLPRGTRSRTISTATQEWAGTSRPPLPGWRHCAGRSATVLTPRIVRWIREGREQQLP